jgi:hypothetical protein
MNPRLMANLPPGLSSSADRTVQQQCNRSTATGQGGNRRDGACEALRRRSGAVSWNHASLFSERWGRRSGSLWSSARLRPIGTRCSRSVPSPTKLRDESECFRGVRPYRRNQHPRWRFLQQAGRWMSEAFRIDFSTKSYTTLGSTMKRGDESRTEVGMRSGVRMTRRSLLGLGCAAASGILTACAGATTRSVPGSPAGTVTEASPRSMATATPASSVTGEPVRVGLLVAFSGPFASHEGAFGPRARTRTR